MSYCIAMRVGPLRILRGSIQLRRLLMLGSLVLTCSLQTDHAMDAKFWRNWGYTIMKIHHNKDAPEMEWVPFLLAKHHDS